MKYVSHDGLRYRCYLSDIGRDSRYLGCFHETPRQAIAHTAPVYVSPLRPSPDGSLAVPVPPRGAALRTRPVTFGETDD